MLVWLQGCIGSRFSQGKQACSETAVDPQTCPSVQVPQLSVPPQPSDAVPQLSPSGHVVAGVQPHWLATPPPPQVSGAVQVPQLRVPPQPSDTEPQLSPAGHVVRGVQPQTFTVSPPPQVWGAVQVPQLPPQPSSPHSLPVQSGVQHTPNFAPDSSTQTPLFPLVPQQLRLVRQTAPSALHPPAVALWCSRSALPCRGPARRGGARAWHRIRIAGGPAPTTPPAQ